MTRGDMSYVREAKGMTRCMALLVVAGDQERRRWRTVRRPRTFYPASPSSYHHAPLAILCSSLAYPPMPCLSVSSKSTDVNVFVVGALGLRFDHCMANIHMLFKYSTGFRRLILLGTESMAFLLQVKLDPIGLSYYKRRTCLQAGAPGERGATSCYYRI